MNNTLVTVFGGSGFLGRHVVRALAGAGYRVRVAVRYPNLAQYLPPMGKVGQIQLFKCNVNDDDHIAAALIGADAAVNLVGILFPADGQNFHAMHVAAPAQIAKAVKAAQISTLVHLSSLGVNRDSDSAYSRSKAEGEDALREQFADATILRPSLVFGPEDNFFNKFAMLARFTPVLPLIGGGHTKFQPVFAGDVAEAVHKSIEDPAMRGRLYELGGPGIYSFKELLQIMLRVIGRKRLLVPVPFFLAAIKAVFLQFLPGTLLTPDQVKLLRTDNVVSPGALTFRDLGITPDAMEAVLPSYLWRFRPKGQFDEQVHGEAVSGIPPA